MTHFPQDVISTSHIYFPWQVISTQPLFLKFPIIQSNSWKLLFKLKTPHLLWCVTPPSVVMCNSTLLLKQGIPDRMQFVPGLTCLFYSTQCLSSTFKFTFTTVLSASSQSSFPIHWFISILSSFSFLLLFFSPTSRERF